MKYIYKFVDIAKSPHHSIEIVLGTVIPMFKTSNLQTDKQQYFIFKFIFYTSVVMVICLFFTQYYNYDKIFRLRLKRNN